MAPFGAKKKKRFLRVLIKSDLNLMTLVHVLAEIELGAEPLPALKTDQHLGLLLIFGNLLLVEIVLWFF